MYFFIGVVVLIGAMVGLTYNGLISGKNKIRNAWSQIEVQLRRKADLIPAMTEIVKGYATHEKETFEEITKSRVKFEGGMNAMDVQKANSDLSGVFSRLMAVAENYPDLKADKNFLDLQQELSKTEDKIAFSRQFYNDVVLDYNNRVRMFPSNLIALSFNFKEEGFFEGETD